jgi:hypothetical protein
MTIPATPSEVSYDGDGTTVAFPIPFVFDTSADLKVIITDADGEPTEQSTGFSITGGSGSTGTCTFDVAPAADEIVTLLDDPELTQTAVYPDNDTFPAEAHEGALDRTVRQVKRLAGRVDRSIRVADGDLSSGDGLLLPIAAARASKFLAFDADGQIIASEGAGGGDTALRSDLAAVVADNDGSRLVGYRVDDADSVGRSVYRRLQRIWTFEDFGAAGTGLVDDTAAINLAFAAAAAARRTLRADSATYLVSGALTVPRVDGFTFFGEGSDRTVIKVAGTFTRLLTLGDTTAQMIRGNWSGFRIDAAFDVNGDPSSAVVQDLIYFARGEELKFEDVHCWGASRAGISNGYGYLNEYRKCEVSYGNTDADCFITNTDYPPTGGLNDIKIYGGLYYSSGGFGFRIKGAYSFAMLGGTVERCRKGGALINNTKNWSFKDVYFEKNAELGYDYATPSVNIKADVHAIGSGASDTVMSNAFTSVNGKCDNCNLIPLAGQEYFLWEGGADSTTLSNITTYDSSVALVGHMYDNQYKGTGIRIIDCPQFTTQVVERSPAAAVNNTPAAYVSIESPTLNIPRQNFAQQDFNQWSVLTAGSAVSFRRSLGGTDLFNLRGRDVWEFASSAAGTSDLMGFALEASDLPWLIGKTVVFGLWVYITDVDRYVRPHCSEQAFNANPTALDTWTLLAVSFTWPASGAVSFGAAKNGADTGSAYVSTPFLVQEGISHDVAASLNPKDPHRWRGSAMPTAGQWVDGDWIENFPAALDGNNLVILGWKRLTTGTAHVAGTDWAVARASHVSPAT